MENGGDSLNYWFAAYDYRFFTLQDVYIFLSHRPPTGLLLLVNFLPAQYLGVSFWVGNLGYCLISILGVNYFLKILHLIFDGLIDNHRVRNKLMLLLLLPNATFWLSGVSKDTLVVNSVIIIVYCILARKYYSVKLVLSLLVITIIRPHILFLLILGIFVFQIQGFVRRGSGLFYLPMVVFFVIVGAPILQSFLGLTELSYESAESFAQERSRNLSRERISSAILISRNPFLAIPTFLFYPIISIRFGFVGFMASLDNSIILLNLFRSLILKKGLKSSPKIVDLKRSIFTFVLLGTYIFSQIMSNVGIILRQKVIFQMALYLLIGLVICENEFRKDRNISQ